MPDSNDSFEERVEAMFKKFITTPAIFDDDLQKNFFAAQKLQNNVSVAPNAPVIFLPAGTKEVDYSGIPPALAAATYKSRMIDSEFNYMTARMQPKMVYKICLVEHEDALEDAFKSGSLKVWTLQNMPFRVNAKLFDVEAQGLVRLADFIDYAGLFGVKITFRAPKKLLIGDRRKARLQELEQQGISEVLGKPKKRFEYLKTLKSDEDLACQWCSSWDWLRRLKK